MTTDIDLWNDDAAPVSSAPADLEAESILAATVMAQPDLVDTLAAEGFDPADISDERLRMVWFAVEELAPSLSSGEIRWEAVARKLAAWQAEGRMTSRPFTSGYLSELYSRAMPGAAEYWAERITRVAVAARTSSLAVTMKIRADSPAFDPAADIAEMQAEIDKLIVDKDFQSKLTARDPEATARWNRLNAAVAAEKDRKERAEAAA